MNRIGVAFAIMLLFIASGCAASGHRDSNPSPAVEQAQPSNAVSLPEEAGKSSDSSEKEPRNEEPQQNTPENSGTGKDGPLQSAPGSSGAEDEKPVQIPPGGYSSGEKWTWRPADGYQKGSLGNERIMKSLKNMSLIEKIGQMFIVGFEGYEPDDSIREMLRDYRVGGVILFQRNIKDPEQLLTLNNSLKKLNTDSSRDSGERIPLFLSVDEEGGRVSRLPEQIHDLPPALSVGEINDRELAYQYGSLLANKVKLFGFNLDYAPVLDIWSNPGNTVIGDRAFGTKPQLVSSMAMQTMKGLREAGVIPVVKHFPGHGDTVMDSHVGLPTVEYDMARLERFELIPFQNAVDQQADVVMIAHIQMKKIDPEYPASLSGKVITDLLRKRMGFPGVVITDDLTMGAIEKNYDIGKAAVYSVMAGSDIIMVCHGHDKQKEALISVLNSVKDGTIPEKRIDESVERILELKERYRINDRPTGAGSVEGVNKKIEALMAKWYNEWDGESRHKTTTGME